MPVRDLSPEEYRALAEFRQAIRDYIHFGEEAARHQGIEARQYQLLLAIKGLPKEDRPTIGTLAIRLHLRHHSTVELVNRMEQTGYLRRVRSLEDRREVLVQLTRSGEALLRRLTLTHRTELETAGPRLARALQHVMAGRTR